MGFIELDPHLGSVGSLQGSFQKRADAAAQLRAQGIPYGSAEYMAISRQQHSAEGTIALAGAGIDNPQNQLSQSNLNRGYI